MELYLQKQQDLLCSSFDVIVFTAAFQTLHRHCTGKTKVDISDLVILRAYCGYHSNQQDLLFHIDFNMVAPAVKFKVTPIPTVPIMPTALSKNLAGPLSMTDLQAEPKAGSVSMQVTGWFGQLDISFNCSFIVWFIEMYSNTPPSGHP